MVFSRFIRQAAGVLPLLFLAGMATPAVSAADTIAVQLDRAKMIKVPEGTMTLILGNPLVADVTLLKGNGSMVLTGRSFGTTNLILLDAGGTPIAESLVQVMPAPGALTVLRGAAQETYSCTPRCAPSVALGDDTKFMNDSIGNVRSRSGAASTGGK
jgi:hypothetical protein